MGLGIMPATRDSRFSGASAQAAMSLSAQDRTGFLLQLAKLLPDGFAHCFRDHCFLEQGKPVKHSIPVS
jgi:hypothetical protein